MRPITWRLAVFAVALSFSLNTTAGAQDRMPPIPAGKMTEAQKKAVAEFEAARGTLSGPWAVILRSPEMVNRARGLSDYLRFNSSLPPRLSEFVILIAAREWTQQYEWNAHHSLAMKGGLSPEIAKSSQIEKLAFDEKQFRWLLNENQMATEKTSEGVRLFNADAMKLEQFIATKL